MLSERKQCYYRTSSDDKRNSTVPTMAEAEFGEWSKQQSQHTDHIADVSEKLADLQMGDPLEPTATYIAQKRPSIIENVVNVFSNLITMASRYGTKPNVQPSAHCLTEKQQYLEKSFIPSTPCIPIFETNRNGKGQLTVPLDYSCTVDDIAMTPAGVYVEELARSERSALRSRRVRKRRKDPSKANQHTHVAGEASGKGCGKNRKEKKRHALRRDILNDNQALSIDDYYYGYDYREGIQSLPQRCLSAGFSPSSTGSVGSFHDALQDITTVESLHLRAASDNVRAVPVSPCNPQQNHPAKQPLTAVPNTANNMIADQEQPKCDIDSNRGEFVVFTDYDVFTTPSASPARRPRPRNLCAAFSYVWHGDDEEEDDQSDYTSDGGITEDDDADGNSTDGGDVFEDDDDDDDSIVFCEDYDDLNDDSNSSSGFEEKKVRFNLKPVVHVMRAWDFAYRQARKGDWEMAARDSERFRKRITDLEPVLGPALQSALRDKIYAERFSGQEDTRKILN
uniref:PP1c_bdg domain-containing protein n=1 Tax=Anopheles funestus TaxID=62324 RepID=A0A182RQF9_ANOFN